MSSLLRPSYLSGLYGIASGSLLRHRMRSCLSILGIICGVSAVFATLSIGEGAKREVLAGIRQLGLDNMIIRRIQLTDPQFLSAMENVSEGLQFKDVSLLRAASANIRDLAYLKEIKVQVSGLSKKVTPQVVACSSSYLSLLGLGALQGRLMVPRDEKMKNLICILGESISKELGAQGKVGQRIRIGDQLFLVVGTVRGTPSSKEKKYNGVALAREINQMIFLPFGTHQYISKDAMTGDDQVLDEVILKLISQKKVEPIVPLIQRTLELSHHSIRDYQLIVPRQLMHQARKTQRIFNLVLSTIGGISLVVGGIGIMNVLLATISERTKEIGIRRAVGATREDIIAQFLAEAMLLTTVGGIIGVIAGFGCSLLIARFADWSVAVSVSTILIPLLTSMVVGICSGVYPAVKAGQMDPVQALRSA